MPRRKRPRHDEGRSGHHNDGWLEQIVAGCGVPEEKYPSYLRFACELYVTMRHKPPLGFSEATKRLVMKWWRRGLAGHVLWRIGAAILDHNHQSAGKQDT